MASLATIAPFGFDAFSPLALLPLYRRLGCRSAQFYRNPAVPVDAGEAKRMAEGVGLPFDSMHGLFGPDLDPSSPDEDVRRHAVEVYRVEADLVLRIGGSQVVVHPAPVRSEDGDTARSSASAAQRERSLRRSVGDLATIGRKMDVVFLLENLPGNYCHGSDTGALAAVVRQIDDTFVRMCFDTGHGHMTTGAKCALEACHDVVTYLHVNDNDGTRDSHGIPGTGTLPWAELTAQIQRLPVEMPAVLELFESEQEIQRQIDGGLGDRLGRWLALVARPQSPSTELRSG